MSDAILPPLGSHFTGVIAEFARPSDRTTAYPTESMQEKRRILRLVLSNSVWKDGRLEPAYKKPFDFLAENNQIAKQKSRFANENGLF